MLTAMTVVYPARFSSSDGRYEKTVCASALWIAAVTEIPCDLHADTSEDVAPADKSRSMRDASEGGVAVSP